ncbi:MAG: hypothetical protein ACE141_13325 [Bryobacteraceae bacterium]
MGDLVPRALVLGLFLLLHAITSPNYLGDTVRYGSEVVRHASGQPVPFWEFGHLLWRPWGYFGLAAFGGWFQHAFGDTPLQATVRFLTASSFLFSCLSLLLLCTLARRISGRAATVAGGLAIAGTNAFLNYSRSGSSYMAAFFWLVAALWALDRGIAGGKSSVFWPIAAGASFGLSAGCWFPFAVSGLGVICFALLWNRTELKLRDGEARRRWRMLAVFLVTLVVGTSLIFALGAKLEGIGSASEFTQWIKDSDNGWAQSMTAVRLVTGLPRCFYDLGPDTVALKRYFFHDPYNPVGLTQLMGAMAVKLGCYYGFAFVLLLSLSLAARLRPLLAIGLSAAIPYLLFAVFVFEPSSPERFLPTLPFLGVAVAGALNAWRGRALAAALAVLALCPLVPNILSMQRRQAGARWHAARLRTAALDRQVNSRAQVFVLSLRDDVYLLPLTRPLDRSPSGHRLEFVDVAEIGSQRIAHWRREFCERTLAAWGQGEEVWISTRLTATRPESSWQWVEGDSPLIRWSDLPAFFGPLETNGQANVPGDGFLRVAPSEANRANFQRFLNPETTAGRAPARRPGPAERSTSPIRLSPAA